MILKKKNVARWLTIVTIIATSNVNDEKRQIAEIMPQKRTSLAKIETITTWSYGEGKSVHVSKV